MLTARRLRAGRTIITLWSDFQVAVSRSQSM